MSLRAGVSLVRRAAFAPAVRAMPARAFAEAAKPAAKPAVAAAAKPAQIQPPAVVYGVEGSYATALWTAASRKNATEQVEADLKAFKEAAEKDATLKSLLEDPFLNPAVKESRLKEIIQKSKYSDVFGNFISLLAENNRLSLLKAINGSYSELMAASRNEITLTITSAKELDAKQRAAVEAAIRKGFVAKNQTLKVVTKVDSKIIGGLLVDVGELSIDLSVSSRLGRLQKLVSEAI